MAGELDLQADDDLLDVGRGSAGLLEQQAVLVRHFVGLDASEIQLGMARRRLGDRIAAGTAEVVMGDAPGSPPRWVGRAHAGHEDPRRGRRLRLPMAHPGRVVLHQQLVLLETGVPG